MNQNWTVRARCSAHQSAIAARAESAGARDCGDKADLMAAAIADDIQANA